MDWQYLSVCSVLGINIRYSPEDININFPKNCFGIIVTIRRGKKLNKYPIDIHGISKIWKYPNSIPKNRILMYIVKCSYKAYNDARSKYFEDILFDRKATIEVSFMVNNIEKVFNNYDQTKGLLISKNDKYIDSYSPNSFESGSGWINIKKYITEKHGDGKIEFYSFPIQTVIIDISDIFDKYDFTNFWVKKLSSNLNIKSKIPYSLKDNNIRYYRSISFDNMYCINSLLKYKNMLDKKVIHNIESIIKQYTINYKIHDMSTLFYLSNNVNDQDIINYFYNKSSNLSVDNNRFSEGEILLTLSEKFDSNVIDLDKKIDYVLENRKVNTDNKEYNLHSLLFRSYVYKGGVIKDIRRIIDQTINTFHFDTLLDTEEMVLLFETFCALHSIVKDDRLFKRIWLLFILIMRKINTNYWIQNKDGTCIFTTTCRMLNALSLYQ